MAFIKNRAFIICPVRDVSPHIQVLAKQEVRYLESKGWEVHLPIRDTNQIDSIGFNICSENLEAIKASDMIYVIWDGHSQGCLFDLGMAFALGKKTKVIHLPLESQGKSFQNMIEYWSKLK